MVVDIGIAANKNQDQHWWAKLMPELLRVAQEGTVQFGEFIVIGSATADHSKNEVARYFMRPATTAENRNGVAEQHLAGGADALCWIDDDTVPPRGFLEALLALEVEVAAGLYYLRRPPYNPVCYRRMPNRNYAPLYDFQVGEILEVDSVGMGCTLVRREVYERIRAEHVLLRRAETGTLCPVHKSDLVETRMLAKQVRRHLGQVLMVGGTVVQLQQLIAVEREVARWPFYAMEYGRTEDHPFCEMAKRVGCRIVVDTAVECQHWGSAAVTGAEFREMRAAMEQGDAGT